MRTVSVQPCMRLPLGKQGENEAVQAIWPGIVEQFRELYGEGVFTLTAKRCGDAEAYPVAVSTEVGDVVWMVQAADVAKPGSGSCELTYTVDGVVAKSQTWSTYVAASISGDAPGEPPEEPATAWFLAIQAQIGDLSKLTTKAKANLVAAINEAAKTGSGGAGSISMRTADGYIQYSTDDGESWENLIALADLKGEPGQDGNPGAPGEDGKPGADGYSPTAKVEETADGAKITITDKAGTTEVTVKNGKDGADGAPGKDGADGAPGKDGTDGTNGTNGITPTIGDNGNWYLGTTDTGKPSRGEKGDQGPAGQDGKDGAPGKDGAGMDVTGATVGQIAKITAVDDNGKPTAWEPADLPGGGDAIKWYLAADRITDEETNEIIITADDEGTPLSAYNAVAMIIAFYIPYDSSQTNDNGKILILPSSSDNGNYRMLTTATSWKTTSHAFNQLFFGIKDGYFSAGSTGGGSVNVFEELTINDFLSVARLKIANTNDHFPVGTKMRVMLLSGGKT